MSSHRHVVLGAYRDMGWRVRLHTLARWSTAPLTELVAMLPERGRILDLGCGHGLASLLLARTSAEREVHSVDVDGAKVAVAAAAADAVGVGARVQVEQVDQRWAPNPGAYDGILIADVLYLLPPEHVAALITAASAGLRAGAMLVVKEMADEPRWKRRVAELQEHVSVRVMGVTAGETIRLPTEAELAAAMRRGGLEVQRRALGRSALHPHVALVGRRS